jgi:hypothetical protein
MSSGNMSSDAANSRLTKELLEEQERLFNEVNLPNCSSVIIYN